MRSLTVVSLVVSLVVSFVVALVACTKSAKPAEPHTTGANANVDVALHGETMGSTWTVKIKIAADGEVRARAMQGPIEELLERVNDQMSTYRPNSEISRFNAHKSTTPFSISNDFAAVVAKALEVGKATDGAFDITLDPLINAWGFDRKGPRTEPPSDDEIARARAHTGLHLIDLDLALALAEGNKGNEANEGNEGNAGNEGNDGAQPTLTKRDPDVTINLGGIASGWAVDEIAKLLESRGMNDWMIEVTGEVRARGTNAKNAPWKIGVKVPDIETDDVVAAAPLVDQSLTTSGSYHNFFEANGKRYHHILDPKTGTPAVTDVVSVTVMYKDAVTADGYDTPFLILGEERARAIIAKHPGMEALFIRQDAKTGELTMTTTAGFPKLEMRARDAKDAGADAVMGAPAQNTRE